MAANLINLFDLLSKANQIALTCYINIKLTVLLVFYRLFRFRQTFHYAHNFRNM